MGRLKNVFHKKITASSLSEVIVATSILLIVFAIALMTLNNIMVNSLQKDTQSLDTVLEKLIYKYKNNQLKVPMSYQEDNYLIEIQKITENDIEFVEFSIKDKNKSKSKISIAITHEK